MRITSRFLVFAALAAVANASQARAAGSVPPTYFDHAPTSCVDFLQRAKDEDAARARVVDPRRDAYYNQNYGASAYYIAGFASGANAYLAGVTNTFPGLAAATVLELVRRECDREPTLSLSQAVVQAINKNRQNWETPAPSQTNLTSSRTP